MILDRRHLLKSAGIAVLGAAVPSAAADAGKASTGSGRLEGLNVVRAAPGNPRPPLLAKALAALDQHANLGLRRDIVGLVDFSEHSSHQRFQIVDLSSGSVRSEFLVAHGRGSDPAHTGYVQEFSNIIGSNSTSRGSYRIAESYIGKYGRSRRLDGLDQENNLARQRAIVMHGASYVSPTLIEQQGRIGRSLGCFALEQSQIGVVLDLLSEDCLLLADIP